MKLNASILFHDLKQSYSCEYFGPETTELALSRPEFYMDRETHFSKNHLYLATVEHLPPRPVIEENVVLICVGKGIHLGYYKERCTLIIVDVPADFFRLYLDIQHIFNVYDEWNDRLFEYFKKDADIQKILDASLPLFGRLLSVIDADFNYLCIAHEEEENYSKIWKNGVFRNVPQESFGVFLDNGSFYTHLKEPLHLNISGCSTLCINLFDSRDTYIGCLMIDRAWDSYNMRDDSLAVYLGKLLEESLNRNGYLISSEHNTKKLLLLDLLNEMPVTQERRLLLQADYDQAKRYLCVSMHSATSFTSIYSNYICNLFETNFPNSIAFPYKHAIAGFIELSRFLNADGEYADRLNAALKNLMKTLKLSAGISNDFSDLENARIYYYQAELAHKNGSLVSPASHYYYFSSYALMEMLSNSLGGLPAEMYYPKGLKKLLEHDASSSVSYLETLQVFLNENMSYNRTAELLYIHRSTLIDRITRIERELGLDLNDPNERLMLMMLFKTMEIDELVKAQNP